MWKGRGKVRRMRMERSEEARMEKGMERGEVRMESGERRKVWMERISCEGRKE